jgi:hypothetical protein
VNGNALNANIVPRRFDLVCPYNSFEILVRIFSIA